MVPHKDRLHSTLALVLEEHELLEDTTPPALVEILLKIINLVNHQLINFLNHRKKGKKKRFSEAEHKFNYLLNLDTCCCRHSLLKSRYDHLWKTCIWYMEKPNEWNDMFYRVGWMFFKVFINGDLLNAWKN